MKAWVLYEIGDIRYEEVEKPQPKETEVLVEIRAAGICGSDIPRIYRDGAHNMPLIPGHEFSGKVVETGSRVDKKWLHRRVGVYPLKPCFSCAACRNGTHEMCRQYGYLGSRQNGGFCEYAAVPEENLIVLPEQVTYEQAAMMEPMAVAVHAMRKMDIGAQDTVCVCGIGTIGAALLMFLMERGLKNIFALGNKEFQKERLAALGLPESHFCDCRYADARKWIYDRTGGRGTDVFFECVGKKETVSLAVDVTAPGGSVCMVGNPCENMVLKKEIYWKLLRNQLDIKGTWNSSFFADCGRQRTERGTPGAEQENTDWFYVLHMLEQRRITPELLISHRFSLAQLEEGAHIMRDKSEDYLKILMVRE